MKLILTLTALLVAAAHLNAGTFDSERPSWAPIEPALALGTKGQLQRDLAAWAKRHQVVSQYDNRGLNATWHWETKVGEDGQRRNVIPYGVAPPWPKLGPLTSDAPNTLTKDELAEVESLNRRINIYNLQHEKHTLEHPRVAVATTPSVDVEQSQLDTIDELKSEIASLKKRIEDRERVVVKEDDTTLSTPVVAGLAGLGGISLASLIGLAFTRRGVVS